jgi:hypothetical protein
VLFMAVGCGSGGGEETPAEPDGGAMHGLTVDSSPAGEATCVPGVEMVAGVPFGPAPPDVSHCPCGTACHIILAPDCKGYYCEQVCDVCP